MLNLDDDHSRNARAGPFLVESMGVLLLDSVISVQLEPLTIVRLQARIRRRFAKPTERAGKVAVVHDQGVARLRMLIETLGKQDASAQVHRSAPELR